jgi:hypothetical protein
MSEIEQPNTVIAFHVHDGPQRMNRLDAQNAVRNWPREWRLQQWSAEARAANDALIARENEALSASNLDPSWHLFSPTVQKQLAIRFGAAASITQDEVGGYLADIEPRGSGA